MPYQLHQNINLNDFICVTAAGSLVLELILPTVNNVNEKQSICAQTARN